LLIKKSHCIHYNNNSSIKVGKSVGGCIKRISGAPVMCAESRCYYSDQIHWPATHFPSSFRHVQVRRLAVRGSAYMKVILLSHITDTDAYACASLIIVHNIRLTTTTALQLFKTMSALVSLYGFIHVIWLYFILYRVRTTILLHYAKWLYVLTRFLHAAHLPI